MEMLIALIFSALFFLQEELTTITVRSTLQRDNQENLVRENVTRQLAGAGGDHSLPNKRPCMIQKEDSAEECTTQEDLLNSIIETSNIFEKVPSYYDKLKTIWHARDSGADYYIIDLGDNEMIKQTHELLCEDELKMLSERLTLNDENNHISTKAHEYLALFDQIIGYPSEEKTTEVNNLIDLKDDNDAKSSVISEMEKTLHSLNEITTKFRYLSNSLPLPVLHYDQSQYPDIHIIKSISSHIDSFTKLEGILENTTERSWTAHILAYFFFITFSFLNTFHVKELFLQKLDLQAVDYKADGVAEFLKRPNQIPVFLLGVSGDPSKPDLDKFSNDRKKLMKEGVFALNKFMMRTNLPTWEVCQNLGIF